MEELPEEIILLVKLFTLNFLRNKKRIQKLAEQKEKERLLIQQNNSLRRQLKLEQKRWREITSTEESEPKKGKYPTPHHRCENCDCFGVVGTFGFVNTVV